MNIIIWVITALLIAAVVVFIASRQTRRLLPAIELPDGESLPATRAQTYARRTLLAISLLTVLAFGIVIHHGAQVWWDNDTVRLTFTFLLLAALLVYLWFSLALKSLENRDDGSFDERDSIIIGRSCSGVCAAMMVVIAAWMIALTETFQATHLVPTYYLYLLFWSCVMTNVIASTAGILLAYRKS
jgi:Ca2+/Na+ antiporter